jgi:GntR family transcriptional regulator, phosphonate transport system regulatory protein
MSLFALDQQPGEARYRRIAMELEKEIAANSKTGMALPSEPELAARFGVNRHTLRRAVDELVNAGLVERRHGRGVFVLRDPIAYPIGSTTRFTSTVACLGHAADSRMVRKQVISAQGGVAQRLALPIGDPVVWFETVRLADSVPLVLISHFLPAARFPGLLDAYDGGSLHALLLKQYDIELTRHESLVTAALPLGDDAELLAMPRNRPVLRVKTVNRITSDGTPGEYALSRFRADRVQLQFAF